MIYDLCMVDGIQVMVRIFVYFYFLEIVCMINCDSMNLLNLFLFRIQFYFISQLNPE